MSVESLQLRTLLDALEELAALRARFRHAHAAALLDGCGAILDLTAFTDPPHTEDDALDRAHCHIRDNPGVRYLILLSAVRGNARLLQADDLRKLRRARAAFARSGVDVVDWIRFDGRWFRSLAISAGWQTWGDGRLPPAPRARRRGEE